MDFGWSHRKRVAFIVVEDEAFNPIEVGLGGSGAEVAERGQISDAVEEFHFRHCSLFLPSAETVIPARRRSSTA